MKCYYTIALLLVATVSTVPVPAQSSTPQAIKLQGFLSDASGGTPVPATGLFSMTFGLYDADVGGSLINSFGPVSVEATEGYYEVDLPFPAGAFGESQRYLEVYINTPAGGEVLAPRIRLGSSPYAFVAETLDGKDGTEFLDTSSNAQIKVGDLTVGDLTATGTMAGNGSNITNLDAGSLAIGIVAEQRIAASIARDSEVPDLVGNDFVHVAGDTMTGSLVIPTGGLCLDVDGNCVPPSGGLGVGLGGIQGTDSSSYNVLLVPNLGNVGVGTTNPSKKLEVLGDGQFTSVGFGVAVDVIADHVSSTSHLGGQVNLYSAVGQKTIMVSADHCDGQFGCFGGDPNDGPLIVLYQPTGGVGIQMRVSDNSGDIYATGSVNAGSITTDVLTIQGGADLSEQFDIREEGFPIRAGLVVSIDPKNSGKLAVSRGAYDRRVAGVVSGAGGVRPGMLMGQKGSLADGDHPVALSGRVYTWADASYGAIEPGDLLTTSDKQGHAMKVSDYDKAQGAIIGKAMTSLDEGQGLVLVLVTLQ